MIKAPPTPKGFRDIDPELAQKRHQVINTIIDVLENAGFEPLETPTIEFAETLKGKYGEEERLIYEFVDRGGRQLALRYDLTVPLARYVASNPNLPLPFRRYQIGQVFRGENPQRGRYREFTQVDFDTVGSESLEEDAKIIATAIKATQAVGLEKAVMLLNDRKTLAGIPLDFIRALDKIHKIGKEGARKELESKNYPKKQINQFLNRYLSGEKTEAAVSILKILKEYIDVQKHVIFDPSLARGLDYYTGSIFELKPNDNPKSLSIGSGGRYDNLIGMFAKRQIPAVGFSFGLDRFIEAL